MMNESDKGRMSAVVKKERIRDRLLRRLIAPGASFPGLVITSDTTGATPGPTISKTAQEDQGQKPARRLLKPEPKHLSDDEFQAVYEWVDAEKDGMTFPFKEGVMKLVNNEMAYRVQHGEKNET